MILSPVGLGNEDHCAGEDQQQFNSHSAQSVEWGVSASVCVEERAS
jgi:hypothetical protein